MQAQALATVALMQRNEAMMFPAFKRATPKYRDLVARVRKADAESKARMQSAAQVSNRVLAAWWASWQLL